MTLAGLFGSRVLHCIKKPLDSGLGHVIVGQKPTSVAGFVHS